MALADKVLKYIYDNSDKALELLTELAQIPSPSGKEFARILYCKNWLFSKGAENVITDRAGNLIYSVGDMNGPLTVFAAHSDVVFPDEDKLPLRKEDGKIFCPGIGDDTANVAVLLMAAGYVAENKLSPEKGGILFVIDTCEEGLGNLKGCRELMNTYGDRVSKFYSLDLQYTSCISSAVGSKRYSITVKTKGGHSFFDFGSPNAIQILSEMIHDLYKTELPANGTTTYNIGKIEGGTSINSIAQHASMLYEFRSDDYDSLCYMEERFNEVLKKYSSQDIELEIENIGTRPCANGVDENSQNKLMEKVRNTVYEHTGKEIPFKSGSTDCNIPLSLGIPSVCIGCYDGNGEHTREEFIYEQSLKTGYRIAFDLILSEFDK